jgi:DNA-binding MarR family transcriptional regulator
VTTDPDKDTMLRFSELFPRIIKLIMHDFISGKSRKYSINQTQIKTLIFLKKHGDSPMSNLCTKTGLEKGSMTSVIDTLTSKQLVTRSRSHQDRRKVIVSLTEHGDTLASACLLEMQDNFQKKISLLNAAEQDTFNRALRDIEKTIHILEQIADE